MINIKITAKELKIKIKEAEAKTAKAEIQIYLAQNKQNKEKRNLSRLKTYHKKLENKIFISTLKN